MHHQRELLLLHLPVQQIEPDQGVWEKLPIPDMLICYLHAKDLFTLDIDNDVSLNPPPVNSPHLSHPSATISHFYASTINCNHNILISFINLRENKRHLLNSSEECRIIG